MTSRRQFSVHVLIVGFITGSAMLLAAYFPVYLYLQNGDDTSHIVGNSGWARPTYRFGSPVADYLFYPAYRLDRYLWQEKWQVAFLVPNVDAGQYAHPLEADLPDGDAAIMEAASRIYVLKGTQALEAGDHSAAVKAFSQAIEAKPDESDPYLNRGRLYEDSGSWQKALDDYKAAVTVNPESYAAHNDVAWLLATCPDDDIRDGTVAIAHATKACELTHWELFATYETLAAAYAQTGQYRLAVDYQNKAIELAPNPSKESLRETLKLFESGEPARLQVPPGR